MADRSGTGRGDRTGTDALAATPRRDLRDLAEQGEIEHPTQLRLSTWSIVRAVLLVVAGIAVVGILVAASTTIWWLAIGSVIAAAFFPVAGLLRKVMPMWLAITLLVLGMIAVTGALGYRGYSELQTQYDAVRTNAIRAAHDIETSVRFGQVAREFGLQTKVQEAFAAGPFEVSEGEAASAVQSAASSGGALFAVFMLTLLMLVFGPRMVRGAVGQITSPGVAPRVARLVHLSYQASTRYVWCMAVRAVVIGLVAGLASAAAGFEAPTAAGLWFAVFSLIPGLGVVLGAVPIAIYVGVSSYPQSVVLFLVAVLFQALDAVFVQSRIESYSVRIGPGLTIVAVLFGVQLYGIGGVLVALAVTIFGLAVLRELAGGHEDVFTAFRALVRPPAVLDALEEVLDTPE